MLNKQHARRWRGLLGQAAGALLITGGLFFSAGALAETYSPTIVNGEDAALGELPWQILIREGDQASHDSNSCGATLAHPNWMITAAHCFPEQTENFTQRDISDPPALFVIAGIVDSSQSEQGVTRPVQRIILHPQYDPATFDNDIALLYVADPIECIHCRAIGIVTAETEATAAPPGTLATVSGWGNRVQQITGQEGNQDFPTRLQKASVPIWDNQACISDFGYTEADITANMLCAGYIDGSRDSCQGDSGGPLVVATPDGSGNVLLAGVVSSGTGCAEPGFTGVYTRVSRYTDWLAASSGGALAGKGGGGGIVINLEEPAADSTYSGVANVRGWAVAPQGMDKVELYVDDQFFSQIPLGGRRADVGDAYPSYPGAAQSGFAMAFNYSNLAAGAHTFTVRAIDATGGARDARVTANVVRFETPYMADPAAVNVDQATLSRGGNAITVQNLLADGKPYTVQLNWRPATQGFALTQINPAGHTAATSDASAVYPEEQNQPTPFPVIRTLAGPGNGARTLQALPAAAGDDIVINLEEPAADSTYSGVANVRGWAVAPQGMDKVELYVDDQFFSQIPLGGRRADVGDAYPSYPGAAQSGFAMAFNYSNLAAGAHTFTVRAIDATGGARDARVTANVVRFETPYMADPAAVNVDQATLSRGGNAITVQNLLADGKPYTVQLNWRPATQGFALTQIDREDEP